MIYTEYTWILVCSVFLSVFVAYGIGANDVGNAFGSSVGAKALTMKQAIIVAAICEFTGASLMGAGVVDTIRGGIAQLEYYTYKPDLLMYGMMCALLATGIWLLLATYWELPVSTTHSIVGAIVGMSMVAGGVDSVLWSAKSPAFPYLKGMSSIVLSWVFSPVLAGVLGVILFLITRHGVLRRKNSFELSLWSFPVYTFLTFFVGTYFIIKKGGQAFGWQKTPDSKAAWLGAWVGGVFFLIAATLGISYIRYRVSKDFEELQAAAAQEEKLAGGSDVSTSADDVVIVDAIKPLAAPVAAHEVKAADALETSNDSGAVAVATAAAAPAPVAGAATTTATPYFLADMRKSRVWGALTSGMNTDIHAVIDDDAKIHDIHAHSECFDPRTELSFKYLQIFTACANSFAHGSNDVANAMGPFAAIYAIWRCSCVDSKSTVPAWILILGGAGIVLGLATYGQKIMRVLGVKMTRLTNSRGYCVELAAAATVILGSRYGLPLSTTHSMVGAVTAIGMLEGSRGFNYKLLFKFFAGWVATLVVAGATSAAFTAQGVYAPNRLGSLEAGALIASAPAPAPMA